MKKFQYVKSQVTNGVRYNWLRYPGQGLVELAGKYDPIADEGDATFKKSHKAALAAAMEAAAGKKRETERETKQRAKGSLRENVDRYLAGPVFAELEPSTQEQRRRVLNRWCDGDKPGNKRRFPGYGHLPLSHITPDAFAKMMYARAHTKGAQRTFLATVRHFLIDCRKARAVAQSFDPTRNEHCGRGGKGDSWKLWPVELVDQYKAYWPLGTMARQAIEVLYGTGAACVDAIRLGPKQVKDGVIIFNRQKTRKTKGEGLTVHPMTTEFEAALAAGPTTVLSGPWLRNSVGTYDAHSFSMQFRAWAHEAGIPKGYSAHGIRKRKATDLAEAGRSANELMVMFGWDDIKQAEHYTKGLDKERVGRRVADELRTGTRG